MFTMWFVVGFLCFCSCVDNDSHQYILLLSHPWLLAQHHSVIERHQLVFHIYAQPCHQLYSILKEEVKQLLRNIAFVSEQLAIQTFSKNLEHIGFLVADICTSKYKRYYLASVIARKVELKAIAPTHCSFSVSGNSLEYLIGISPEIIAYGYHR